MQVVRTKVASAITPTANPLFACCFCGEGGEYVAVDMASVEGFPHERQAAVGWAKAILVQTAGFDVAPNAYDAQSNGNFDELAVTSAHDQRGDVYVFVYRDGEASRKSLRLPMPSLDAANAEAVRGAVDLLMDLQAGTDELSGWLVRVWDQNGKVVSTVDVQEAEAARQSSQCATWRRIGMSCDRIADAGYEVEVVAKLAGLTRFQVFRLIEKYGARARQLALEIGGPQNSPREPNITDHIAKRLLDRPVHLP